jgi:hypothetical protein
MRLPLGSAKSEFAQPNYIGRYEWMRRANFGFARGFSLTWDNSSLENMDVMDVFMFEASVPLTSDAGVGAVSARNSSAAPRAISEEPF